MKSSGSHCFNFLATSWLAFILSLIFFLKSSNPISILGLVANSSCTLFNSSCTFSNSASNSAFAISVSAPVSAPVPGVSAFVVSVSASTSSTSFSSSGDSDSSHLFIYFWICFNSSLEIIRYNRCDWSLSLSS